ncbi:unnamed protein product, partial [Symbiodinium sp. KB8]
AFSERWRRLSGWKEPFSVSPTAHCRPQPSSAAWVPHPVSVLTNRHSRIWILQALQIAIERGKHIHVLIARLKLLLVELCDGRLKELKARMGNTEVPSLAEALSWQYQDGQWALDGPKYCQHAATWNAGLCNLVGQAAIAKIFDLRPGAEFFAAIEVAEQRNLPLVCGDRDVDETMQDLKEAFLKDWWSLLTSSSQVPGTKGRERLTVASLVAARLRDREMIARLREELKLSMQRYAESSKSGVAQGSALQRALQRCTSL